MKPVQKQSLDEKDEVARKLEEYKKKNPKFWEDISKSRYTRYYMINMLIAICNGILYRKL